MSDAKPTAAGEIVLPKLSVSLTMPPEGAKTEEAKAPPTVETQHTLALPGGEIAYNATAGLLTLRDDEGKERARLFHTAYVRQGVEDASRRPVLFAFNGGPGSSSVWLHLGAWGPRRVVLGPEGQQPAPPPQLADNPHTLLDQADLVFIDPVGTGLSKPSEGIEAKEFHGVEGDLESVGRFIAQWVTEHGRWTSPIYLGGESYGTLRSAGLAHLLQERHGLYLSGLVLVSVVLNMQTIRFAEGNDLPYVLFLPSYAATAWHHGALAPDLQARPLEELLAEVERFAVEDYSVALLRGASLDPVGYEAVLRKLARYTGLGRAYLDRCRLRVDMGRFGKELLRDRGRTVGRLDSRYTGIDRDDAGENPETDPSHTAIFGAFAGAFNHYLRTELNYQAETRYQIMAELYNNWNYGDWQNRYLDLSERLRQALSHNPHLRVFAANGYFDLATPYFATQYTFDHLMLPPELRAHLAMGHYQAGHMMYVKESEAGRLAEDVRRFLGGA
jgi:carboxypeptidase C (cathepsin A)